MFVIESGDPTTCIPHTNLRELQSTVTWELRKLIQCWCFVLKLLKIIVSLLRVILLWNVYISVKCQRKFLKILKRVRVRVDCIYLIQDRIWERAFVNTVTNTWVKGGELRRLPKEDSAPQNVLFENMKTLLKITMFRISCPELSSYFNLLMTSSRHIEGYAKKDPYRVQQHCKEWFVIFIVAWDVFVSSVC
jgi:hypothetical protein